jgi:hypothetical protein
MWVKHKNKDWDSGPPVELARTAASLDDLLAVDPDFSRVVFEDFMFRLYATAHGARGVPGKLDELAPYLGPEARAALANRPPADQPVTRRGDRRDAHLPGDVPTADDLAAGEAPWCIGLEFEANYTVGTSKRFAVERWRLRRAATARTKPPSAARIYTCPNCGAPWADRRRRRRPALRVVRRGRRQRPLRLGGRGHRAAPRAQQPARPDRRGARARHRPADLPRRSLDQRWLR